jgi:hypothetical protein
MRHFLTWTTTTIVAAMMSVAAVAGDITPFIGEYAGSAKIELADGSEQPRDMSVMIRATKDGFVVEWSSVSYRDDGRTKAKSYKVDFLPSGRGEVFAAAMQRNVFGHAVPLDPMKGEPYVWARIEGDTLSVFSLFVSETGGYELQQFDRTLAAGGLDLHFQRFSNGVQQRQVKTFLAKQN